jgi:hypothetical protein
MAVVRYENTIKEVILDKRKYIDEKTTFKVLEKKNYLENGYQCFDLLYLKQISYIEL